MSNNFTDPHQIKEDNEYVFVEFDEEMEIDVDSYDCCEDEELSFLSQSPSCSVSVCTENMFVEETSFLNETNTASVVSLEEKQEGTCDNTENIEDKVSDIDAMIECLEDNEEDETMENIISSEEEDRKLQDILLFGTHERTEMLETVETESSNHQSLKKIETSKGNTLTDQSTKQDGMSRLSNKKRRKKMKQQKKKAAAVNAATALAKMRERKSVSSKKVVPVTEHDRKKSSSSDKKSRKNMPSSKPSVACAATTLAAFREQQQGLKKATRKINYVALL